jgi:hypothetical protein
MSGTDYKSAPSGSRRGLFFAPFVPALCALWLMDFIILKVTSYHLHHP